MTNQPGTNTLDLRGLTITTAIVGAAQERLSALPDGEGIDLLVEHAPGIMPDLQAWSRATGHKVPAAAP